MDSEHRKYPQKYIYCTLPYNKQAKELNRCFTKEDTQMADKHTVLVLQSCHNKAMQTAWHKQQKLISHGSESRKSKINNPVTSVGFL